MSRADETLTPEIALEAARWYLALQEQPVAETLLADWRRWYERDIRHRHAWQRAEKLCGMLGSVSGPAALATLDAPVEARRHALKVLSLLLLAGGAGSLAWTTQGQRWLAQERTAKGERRRLALPDGSLLHMNSDTRLNLHFDENRRSVELIDGEILVITTADPLRRPFVVVTEHGAMRALGTRFDVRRTDDHTRLGVLEHAVEVRLAAAGDPPLRVEQGYQVSFSTHRAWPVEALPPHTDAWTDGRLFADEMPLGRFLAELERHRPGFLRCAPEVTDLRLSGSFRLDDTDAILRGLAAILPVAVRFRSRYWVVVEAA
ncbi:MULTISPECIES: FecR domain-containing protein [unclassified Pseudomonas]|uniref:FecR domain-containing protein n=1 Tax=unclassified Pseudomonas TaxID=196821 RepID=UPI0024478144|nr:MULTISPECIES: FecR domain-containing protein [unclassified Pseudomonas]MDH0892915.1 FecR domain-containing protein [Pseudomonas sp. GD03875]MDH1064611.1 FecR domain-containing protein [Pseudomonas sp. GD03985]